MANTFLFLAEGKMLNVYALKWQNTFLYLAEGKLCSKWQQMFSSHSLRGKFLWMSTSVLLRDNVCNEWVFFDSHAKSLFAQKGIKVIVEGCYQHLTWQGWGDPVWSQWVTSLNWPGPLVTRRGRRPWVFKSRTYAPWLVSEDCISARQCLHLYTRYNR